MRWQCCLNARQSTAQPNGCCMENCVRASAQLQRIPQSPGHAAWKSSLWSRFLVTVHQAKAIPITASIVSHRPLRASQTWVGYQLESKHWQINKYINNSIRAFIPSPRDCFFVSEHRYEGWLRGQNHWIYLKRMKLANTAKKWQQLQASPGTSTRSSPRFLSTSSLTT